MALFLRDTETSHITPWSTKNLGYNTMVLISRNPFFNFCLIHLVHHGALCGVIRYVDEVLFLLHQGWIRADQLRSTKDIFVQTSPNLSFALIKEITFYCLFNLLSTFLPFDTKRNILTNAVISVPKNSLDPSENSLTCAWKAYVQIM